VHMAKPELKIFESKSELTKSIGEFVAKLSKESISLHGKFFIAVSGGSLPSLLSADIVKEPLKSTIEWNKWHVFFVDERFLPHDSPESNYFACHKHLFSQVSIPEKQIYAVKTTDTTIQKSTSDYQKTLSQVFNTDKLPSFDLILLGMGPDGHTASLFPGHKLLEESKKWISYVEDSPKPPPQRVTFTLPLLNNAKNVAFVLEGETKKEILRDVFTSHSQQYPPNLVKPIHGSIWFVDHFAALFLHNH